MLANFLFYMQFKNFLKTCQNFDHEYWCANSLAMNQLMTTNFGNTMVLAGQELEANQSGPNCIYEFDICYWREGRLVGLLSEIIKDNKAIC